MAVRIFMPPSFADWAKQHDVSDTTLCEAAAEVEDGLVDARLGGYLIKKRMASPGRGKSGSNRAIIAHRQGDRLIFLFGFRKKDMENIKKNEKAALLKIGESLMGIADSDIGSALEKGAIIEVKCDEPDSEECAC